MTFHLRLSHNPISHHSDEPFQHNGDLNIETFPANSCDIFKVVWHKFFNILINYNISENIFKIWYTVIPGSPIGTTVLIRPIPTIYLSIAHHVFPNTFAGYLTLELERSCTGRTMELVRIIITIRITITPLPCFQAVAIGTLIMMWCLARAILLVWSIQTIPNKITFDIPPFIDACPVYAAMLTFYDDKML